MKGIVFTEFIDLVEEHFDPDVADRMITAAELPGGGAYTSVGTYPHAELVRMVVALGQITGVPLGDLIALFGGHLAKRFKQLFPAFFAEQPDLFSFLASIDSHIHIEVRKLYPDAELPSFPVESRDAQRMTLLYRSQRCFEDLAEGLILGCARQYGESVRLRRETLDGQGTRFVIERDAAAH
ncbi:heme NO-binding domain-containing protein [Azohydromonas aeria]|uniref:heme NO-binding domain-containing protein n=1 Tax=Azohydromonas aeria TaxID=2590212 RepID=UPI0012FBA625|nr:heme NO-binding domain-containing protein [Azohydromonas aeria]